MLPRSCITVFKTLEGCYSVEAIVLVAGNFPSTASRIDVERA